MTALSDLSSRLQSLKEDIARVESHRDSIRAKIASAEADAERFRYDADLQQKSSEVIKMWLEDMLRSDVDSVASLVTSCLKHVIYDQDLSFRVNQEIKNNRVSMNFLIDDDGVEGDPMSSFGGGAVLMASFILRLAVMSRMRMGNLLLLDETMFAVANRYVPAAADFMHKLSEETGVNILMVTHNDEFMNNAHVAYEGYLAPGGDGRRSFHVHRRPVR